MAYVVAFRCGTVSVEKQPLEGGIVVLKGPRRELERRLSARARHSYDGVTLLVPGIPEAETDKEAQDALSRFISFMAQSPAKVPRAQEPRST